MTTVQKELLKHLKSDCVHIVINIKTRYYVYGKL